MLRVQERYKAKIYQHVVLSRRDFELIAVQIKEHGDINIICDGYKFESFIELEEKYSSDIMKELQIKIDAMAYIFIKMENVIFTDKIIQMREAYVYVYSETNEHLAKSIFYDLNDIFEKSSNKKQEDQLSEVKITNNINDLYADRQDFHSIKKPINGFWRRLFSIKAITEMIIAGVAVYYFTK